MNVYTGTSAMEEPATSVFIIFHTTCRHNPEDCISVLDTIKTSNLTIHVHLSETSWVVIRVLHNSCHFVCHTSMLSIFLNNYRQVKKRRTIGISKLLLGVVQKNKFILFVLFISSRDF
jgi:hypothetical protein